MTEFTETALRHHCRNPRCRMKLPAPVSNEREAFCTRGCHRAFYRKRCLVCEAAMERRSEQQLVCGKRKCRNALRSGQGFGRYHTAIAAVSPSKKPVNKGPKLALDHRRGVEWAIGVNSARIRAPRRVLNAVFGRVKVAR